MLVTFERTVLKNDDRASSSGGWLGEGEGEGEGEGMARARRTCRRHRSQMEDGRCQPGGLCHVVEGQRAIRREDMPGGMRGGPPLRDKGLSKR